MSVAVEKPVDSYLSQLVDQCEAHGRQHRTGAQQPKKETCISILNKIRNMLPRLCNSFFSPGQSSPADVLRISKFFRMILSKSLCVYAGAVFDDGDLEAVAPLLFAVWQLLLQPEYTEAYETLMGNLALLSTLVQGRSLEAFACLFEDVVVTLDDAHELMRRALVHGWPSAVEQEGGGAAASVKLLAFTGAARLVQLHRSQRPPASPSKGGTEASGSTPVEGALLDLKTPSSVLRLIVLATQALSRDLEAHAHFVAPLPAFQRLGKALAAQLDLLTDARLPVLLSIGAEEKAASGLLHDLQAKTFAALERFLACLHLPPEFVQALLLLSMLNFIEHQLRLEAAATPTKAGPTLQCDPSVLLALLRSLVQLLEPPASSRPFTNSVFPQVLPQVLRTLSLAISIRPCQGQSTAVSAHQRATQATLFWALRRAIAEWPTSAWHVALLDKEFGRLAMDSFSSADVSLCCLVAICKRPEDARQAVRARVLDKSPQRRKRKHPDRGEGGRAREQSEREGGAPGSKQARLTRETSGEARRAGESDMAVSEEPAGVAVVLGRTPAAAGGWQGGGGATLSIVVQRIVNQGLAAVDELRRLSGSREAASNMEVWVADVTRAAARAALGLQVMSYVLHLSEQPHGEPPAGEPAWSTVAADLLVRRAAEVLDAFPLNQLEVVLHTAVPHHLLNLVLACMALVPLHEKGGAPPLEPVKKMLGHLAKAAIECLSRKQFVDALLPELERHAPEPVIKLPEIGQAAVLAHAYRLPALEKLLLLGCCGWSVVCETVDASPPLKPVPACLLEYLPEAVNRAAGEVLSMAQAVDHLLQLLVAESTPRPFLVLLLRYLPVLLQTVLADVSSEMGSNAAALAALCLAAGRHLLVTCKKDKEMMLSVCECMHGCVSACFYGGVVGGSRPRIRWSVVELTEQQHAGGGDTEQSVEAAVCKLPPRHLESLVVLTMTFSSLIGPGTASAVRLRAARLLMTVLGCVPRSVLLSEKAGHAAAPLPKMLLNFLRDADGAVRDFMASRMDMFIQKKAAFSQLMVLNWSFVEDEAKLFEQAMSTVNRELEEVRQTLEGKLETSNNAPQLYMDFLKGLGSMAVRCPNEQAFEAFFLWIIITLVRTWGKRHICCSVAFEQLYRISRQSRINLEESLARNAESCFLPLYQSLIENGLLEAFVGEVLSECRSMDAFLECSLKFVITGATLKHDLPFLEKLALVWDRYLGPGSSKAASEQDYADEVRKRSPLWGMLVAYASPVVARLFLVDFSSVGWYYKQIPGHTPTGTKIQGMFCEVVWAMAEAECNHDDARKKAALAALKALAALTEMKERGDDPLEGMTQVDEWSHDSDVATYVESNFLYALSKVVLTFDWRRRPAHINLVAMTLLRQLLELIPRKRLSNVFSKVMVVMNVMLEEGGVGVDGHGGSPEVHARACETLATFVRMLSDSDLLANMAVIVVTIVPAIAPEGEAAQGRGAQDGAWLKSRRILLDLLNWLIVTKRKSLSEAFVGIPFLPALPELKQAQEVLNESVPPTSQLPARLKRLIPLLAHDSAPVRLQTLKQVHRVLRDGRRHLFDLIAGSDVAEDVVSQLLTALLRLRMDGDPAHRLTCCACLGELGAIDPARVSVNLYAKSEHGSQGGSPPLVAPWTINDSKLGLLLLSEMLVPTIRAATKDHDRFPFAIQEILKLLYKRGPTRLDDGASPGDAMSTQVEVDEKERRAKPMPPWLQEALEQEQVLGVVKPFWSTNYVVHKQGLPSKPPFLTGGGSSSGQSFRNRLGTFCLYLIDLSRGPFYDLFYACRGIVRPHEALKNFLLPYLVVDAWCHGDEHIKGVVMAEIMSVLGPAPQQAGMSAADPVAIQAMLSLIDTLMDWASSRRVDMAEERRRRQAAQKQKKGAAAVVDDDHDEAGGAGGLGSEGVWRPKVEEVRSLLHLIPRTLLVKASLRIRAYTRALKYLEQHVREARRDSSSSSATQDQQPRQLSLMTGESAVSQWTDQLPTVSQLSMGNDGANNTLPSLESSEVDLFQLIFSRLDEPDSMCGLAAVRRKAGKPKTLRQRIREYEHDEDWSSALQGYEQAMLALENQAAAMAVDDGSPVTTTEQPDGEESVAEKRSREKKAEIAKGMLQSLIELDQVDSALNVFMAMVSRDADLRQPLLPAGIEACWRLQRWPTLRDLGAEAFQARFDDPDERFQVALGQVLLSISDRDPPAVEAALKLARNEAMASLSAASMESYQRAYPSLVKLHILHELEQGHDLLTRPAAGEAAEDAMNVDGGGVSESVKGLLEDWGWENRLAVMRTSARQSAPVLAARRALFQMAGLRGLAAETWLTQAARATEAGCFRLAESGLRQAACLGLNGERLTLQEAKVLQAQQRVHEALLLLEPVEVDVGLLRVRMTNVVKSASGAVAETHREQAATRLLLTTDWMVEAKVKHGQQVLDRYNLTTTLLPKSEACYFSLASYYDFLLDARGKELREQQQGGGGREDERALAEDALYQTYLRQTIESYATSLHNGLEHIFQSMPRLLTLCGLVQSMAYANPSIASAAARATRTGQSVPPLGKTVQDCYTHVSKAVASVPSFAWYTCLPQLLSQVGVSVPTGHDLRTLVLEAVVKVLSSHPEQAVWSITGLTQSKDTQRKKLGEKILASACSRLHESEQDDQARMLEQSKMLFRELILLAQADNDPESANNEKRLTHLKIAIGKKISLPSFLVPLQAALTVSLPRPLPKHRAAAASMLHQQRMNWYDAFPNSQLQIRMFDETAQVLNSKAKPKKVTLYTTCDRRITFLCKQEKSGDLRKDARIMEFNGLVNRLLQRDAEGRRRNLRLRTYAVVCLNEECGLIEWVPRTQCLRNCIVESQRSSGMAGKLPPFREVRAAIERMQGEHEKDVATMAREYKDAIASQYRPTLHHWFVTQYPEPTAWFEARTAFTRSAAVWSSVGHVIGLGDRHGENILVDTAGGELVHVDFDCLFDKGLHLQRPELVPFRLTPNMVDAMGVTGYEGIFRRVMEVALTVLREHRHTLASVLEPFVNDSAVHWDHNHTRAGGAALDGSISPLLLLSERLQGIYNLRVPSKPRRKHGSRGGTAAAQSAALPGGGSAGGSRPADVALPLSVPGQVQKLIHEATALENLCQMYIGWMAFM